MQVLIICVLLALFPLYQGTNNNNSNTNSNTTPTPTPTTNTPSSTSTSPPLPPNSNTETTIDNATIPEAPPNNTPVSRRKGKPKNKPSKEQKTYKCTHVKCYHGMYGDERAQYTTSQQLRQHERLGVEHPCEDCAVCKYYKDIEEWVPPPVGFLKCDHTGCKQVLKNHSNKSHHEKNIAIHKPEFCGESCVACLRVNANHDKQVKRDEKKQTCGVNTCAEQTKSLQITTTISKLRELADKLEQTQNAAQNTTQDIAHKPIILGHLPENGWVACKLGEERYKNNTKAQTSVNI